MDSCPPGFSVRGIFQARTLEWVAILFSRRSSQPKDPTHISRISSISRQVLYQCITWEALSYVIHAKLSEFRKTSVYSPGSCDDLYGLVVALLQVVSNPGNREAASIWNTPFHVRERENKWRNNKMPLNVILFGMTCHSYSLLIVQTASFGQT